MLALLELARALKTPGQVNAPLPGVFYTSEEVFELEREHLFPQLWFFAERAPEMTRSGDLRTVEFGGESLLLVRGEDDRIRCFPNVCTHRGARLVDVDRKRCRTIVCPYHAWSYSLSGELVRARDAAVEQSAARFALQELTCFERWGLVFANLSSGAALPQEALERLTAVFDFHELGSTQVAAQKSYSCRVNWKLFVENFLECFHCAINHPEFRKTAAFIGHLEHGRMKAILADENDFAERARTSGRPLFPAQTIDTRVSTFSQARTFALGYGNLTASDDGRPVGELLGNHQAFDGGHCYGALGPFFHFFVYSDYAVLFRFLPTQVNEVDVRLTWLVSSKSSEVDLERLTWFWDRTIRQDIKITENAQRGVSSRFYRAGAYSGIEADSAAFTSWYRHMFTTLFEEVSC